MATESRVSPPHIGHARSSFRFPSSRCDQCSSRVQENGRNLVVCIDGTQSEQFGQNSTNVAKLHTKIDLGSTHPEQRAYYSSGIGTRPQSLHVLDRFERAFAAKFDMAIAWNIEEIVKDAYGWLARTYQEGDQIYLFGFSQGAYQVRVLAGMIHEVGLVTTPTEKEIGTAYDHYEVIRSGRLQTREIAREFKNTFSWKGLRVHFIGVWDTVSAVGLVRGDVFLSTSSSAAHACHFRHALALDEIRVKFMPEYFHEMNSHTDDAKSKYIVTSPHVEDVENPKWSATDIKEVWFAGSHSDVGGRNRPGKSYQAGNVSLIWMRREAAANGLVLQPTDIVWVPDDIDFGPSNPMSHAWRAFEYIPIKHQVTFSGAGQHARQVHRMQPRRIIPGQKVHASILYANAYRPKASLGEGFDIPLLDPELDAMELDSQFWETGLFDGSAAQELVDDLGGQQGVTPIYLDRLLFMLRFKEGRQCVRNVPNWQNQFMSLIHNRECAPLVRLVTIIAYYETSCDPDVNIASLHASLEQHIFDDARQTLAAILSAHKHRDGPRVIALLRPLTKHQVLRKRILTQDVLDTLMHFFDVIISEIGVNFGQAMDAMNCLLKCEDTRLTIVNKLGANYPRSNASRLSRILAANAPHQLSAVLRMVMTLARIPEARSVCSVVKPRIRELARKEERLIGLLAIEILLAVYDPNEQEQLNIRDVRVRANLASALVRLDPDRDDSSHTTDPGKYLMRQLFGLDAPELADMQRKLLGELRVAVQMGSTRERTAATMTLLKLCESPIIRVHLVEINLLRVFVSQLRRKDSALLAAYALATCLNYSDMKEYVKDDEELPGNIVGMLRLDYFDDAVGNVEGFQIFGDIMQHAHLRKKIKNYNITEILNMKLGKGKPKEIRTSLIYLDIFRSFDGQDPSISELVNKSLNYLRCPLWKEQKAGVTILSVLAQTEHGVAAISPRIYEIIEMLLPEGYLPILPTAAGENHENQSFTDEGGMQSDVETTSELPDALEILPPSWMMGPACALRILAQNKLLRNEMHQTIQYGSLKHLYLSRTLVNEVDTSAWRIRTPNRADVINMLDKVFKLVDEELSEDGLMSIENAGLPHIQHWDRLVTLVCDRSLAAVTFLPALVGVSVLAVLGVVVFTPTYLSVRVIKSLRSLYQDSEILAILRRRDDY